MHTSQRIMPCPCHKELHSTAQRRAAKIETHFMQFSLGPCLSLSLCSRLAPLSAPRNFNKLCKNVRGFRAFPFAMRSFQSFGNILLAVLFKFAGIFYLLNKQNSTQSTKNRNITTCICAAQREHKRTLNPFRGSIQIKILWKTIVNP